MSESVGEREAFWKWVEDCGCDTDGAWSAWQARAALAAQAAPPQPAEPKQPSDAELLETVRDEMTLWGEGASITDEAEILRVVRRVLAEHGAQAAQPEPRPWKWRHIKSGGEYSLLGNAHVQCDYPLKDCEEVYVYQGDDGRMWVRPVAEFNARFRRVAAMQADSGAQEGDRG
jgi:hypothetical protein